ncbi:MAG: hypothetical protein NUW01_10800 [Gemmatimonadaceae bacterium]|nr:hypothetical protein [Gemmatimonadaceae bacterium]
MARTRKSRSSEPPELPTMRRRLRFGGLQLVGLGLIMLIPVLAAFKVFGAGSATAADRGAALRMSVEYPPRIRRGSMEVVAVLVTNAGPSPLDTVTVRFDSAYVARFTDPQFVPSPSRAFEVELADVAPGETRRVQLGMRANEYGRHRGRIDAIHAGDSAGVGISTVVLP